MKPKNYTTFYAITMGGSIGYKTEKIMVYYKNFDEYWRLPDPAKSERTEREYYDYWNWRKNRKKKKK